MSKKTLDKVSCSGGNDTASKHPLIYLKVDKESETVCPYCSKKFILNEKNGRLYLESHA